MVVDGDYDHWFIARGAETATKVYVVRWLDTYFTVVWFE